MILIKRIINDGDNSNSLVSKRVTPCVPPVTRFNGFRNILKFRAAMNSARVNNRNFFKYIILSPTYTYILCNNY